MAPASRDDLEAQLADVRDRLARLEERVPLPSAEAAPGRFWALEALRAAAGPRGRLVFAGTVETPEGQRLEWQEEHEPAGLVAAEWSTVAGALVALGHPVRLQVLRAVLRGCHTVRELGELPELAAGTSGQLYHHLRELQAAGWMRQARRNHYAVPGDRVVALLVILSAAGLSSDPGKPA